MERATTPQAAPGALTAHTPPHANKKRPPLRVSLLRCLRRLPTRPRTVRVRIRASWCAWAILTRTSGHPCCGCGTVWSPPRRRILVIMLTAITAQGRHPSSAPVQALARSMTRPAPLHEHPATPSTASRTPATDHCRLSPGSRSAAWLTAASVPPRLPCVTVSTKGRCVPSGVSSTGRDGKAGVASRTRIDSELSRWSPKA